jgi:hypothetical protein
MDLRRSLFLEAADSASRVQRALLAVADLDKPLSSLDCLSEPMDYAGLAKAHLVAGMETIRALDSVSVGFVELLLGLCEVRFQAELSRAEVDEATNERWSPAGPSHSEPLRSEAATCG